MAKARAKTFKGKVIFPGFTTKGVVYKGGDIFKTKNEASYRHLINTKRLEQ